MTAHRRSPELEADVQADIRLELARSGDVCLFRNKTGVARHGFGEAERVVRYGLIVGGSDLVGVLRVSVGGTTIGRFLALEVKRPGETIPSDPNHPQVLFLNLIRRFGGFGAFVNSVDSALAAVQRAREGAFE